MSTQEPERVVYEEYVVQEPDRVARVMRYGIIYLIIAILCVLVYAVLAGVFAPPAPRTLAENSLLQAEAVTRKDPGNGKAWAVLAAAQYSTGDEKEAWNSIALARNKVKDRSILYVNLRELDFLLSEGKNEQAIKRADEFLETEANYQLEEKAANLEKGITVPDVVAGNVDAERLFVLKAAALGNLGQWQEAIKTLDSVLQLNDRAADIIVLRGWARLRAGDAAGATEDFERALLFLPDDPSARAGLAEASGEATSTE